MNYDAINELLKEHGWSRRQLALKAGIDPTKMGLWFSRKTRRVPMRDVLAIADVLDVPWETIKMLNDDEITYEVLSDVTAWNDEKRNSYTDKQLLEDFHNLLPGDQTWLISWIRLKVYEANQIRIQTLMEGK